MVEALVPRVIVTKKLVSFGKSLFNEGEMLRSIKVDVKIFLICHVMGDESVLRLSCESRHYIVVL